MLRCWREFVSAVQQDVILLWNFVTDPFPPCLAVGGAFIAYIEARTELARGMQRLAYAHKMRTGNDPTGVANSTEALSNSLDLRAGSETRYEAGVGGMHEFVDEGATTRGDH